MSSAYGILGWVDIFAEAWVIVVLEEVHALTVQFLDALPYLAEVLVVVCEIEFLTPVAEIRGEYEQTFIVIKIRRKYLAILISHFFINRPSDNRNYLDSST